MSIKPSAISHQPSAANSSSCELVDPRATASLTQLLEEAHAFACQLQVSPGERVLLMTTPGIAWARAYFAILLAGAVVVPVCLTSPAPEVAYIAHDSGARLAIASSDFHSLLPGQLHVIDSVFLGIDEPTIQRPGWRAANPTDTALLLYTSGTTGTPKGVMLTHANLAAQTEALRIAWGIGPADVLLHALPMHHLHGVVVAFLTAISAGASLLMLPKFDASAVLAQMHRATVFMAVPTMYERLVSLLEMDAAHAPAVRKLRLATSGSAALPASLARRWERFAGSIPLERYGMTEIGIALSNPLDPSLRRRGFVGEALPSVETRIVGDDGVDADSGELWVRGPSVMAGYFGREAETRAAFADGWFRTGDIAVRDAGFIKLLGRASTDILKSGGEKVSALEVEEALREHPAIAEVAVIGVPDDLWGERVVAVLAARAGRTAECETNPLRAWTKERLAPFKVPRQFVVLAEGQSLPRNAMGKVLKSELARLVGPPT